MRFLILPILFTIDIGLAQTEKPTSKIDGTYYLLESESGINNQQTKTKLFQLAENNGLRMLAIAACEKCVPAIYTYKREDSESLKRHTFLTPWEFL